MITNFTDFRYDYERYKPERLSCPASYGSHTPKSYLLKPHHY